MNVLVRFHAGIAIASSAEGVDQEADLKALGFSASPDYFGDYDYICDSENRKIGVSFIVAGDESVLKSQLFSQSQNVCWDGTMVSFSFYETKSWHIESAQEMGAVVYVSEADEAILFLPDCALEIDVLREWKPFR